MDVEQKDMRFLGICGIIKETTKLISTYWKTIFSKITLAFILPKTLLFFAYMEFSRFFIPKITQTNTPQFYKLSHFFSSEIIFYLLFQFAYIIISLVFTLLSLSTATYAVACIYTAGHVTFRQLISVVPKVWKRLLLTFLSVSLSIFGITFLSMGIVGLIMMVFLLNSGPSGFGNAGLIFVFFFTIFFIGGIYYLTVIWQLSYPISVLEDLRGFKAMAKSRELIKGKMAVAGTIILMVSIPLSASQLVFHYLVVQSESLGVVSRVILGILCFLLLMVFSLVMLVADAVLYFVCKSSHDEKIDMSAFFDHLQVSTDYVPFKPIDSV